MKQIKALRTDFGNEPARQYMAEDEHLIKQTYYDKGEEVGSRAADLVKIAGSSKITNITFYKDGKEVSGPTFH